MGEIFHHSCYGAHVCSDFSLSPLAKVSEQRPARGSIKIKLSKKKAASKYKNNETSVSPEFGYYYRKSIGLFQIFNGEKIEVSPETDLSNPDLIRILLNYPFACLMQQRNMFLLHASAVEFNNRIFIFPGPSLCGKSTIASFLMTQGARMLSEDTSVIKLQGKKAVILPSYPMIKISNSANKVIKFSNKEGIFFPMDKNCRKGFLLNSNNFCGEEKLIDFCIFPQWGEDRLLLEKLSFTKCLPKLMNSSLSIYPLTQQKEISLLQKNAQFYKSVSSYLYTRAKNFKNLETLCEMIRNL